MLTSPEIQFGPFTWCLEATPQGVDEDRLVVSEESKLKKMMIIDNVILMESLKKYLNQVTLGRVDGPGQPMSRLLARFL